MLKSVKLKNFQRWKRQTLTFGPGVNTIHGPSDSGKSSLMRALEWHMLNDAPDTFPDFCHWDAETKSCSVNLELDEHRIIRRRKEGGLNSYVLDGRQYDAVRTDVPEPVSKVLRVSPVNFQTQHSSAFWLADSPASVSRQLNQIIDLEQIDLSLSRAASEVRSAKNHADIFRAQAIESRATRDALAWTQSADKDLSALEILESEIEELQETIATLEEIGESIQMIDSESEESVDLLQTAQELLQLASEIEVSRSIIQELETIARQLNSIEERDGALIQAAEDILTDSERLQALQSEVIDLSMLHKSLKQEAAESCQLEQEVSQLKRELKAISKSTCPACGRAFGST